MNSDPGTYASLFLEDSLGLPAGSISQASIPSSLVSRLVSAMRGSPDSASEVPVLEEETLGFLEGVEQRSLASAGFSVRKARWPKAAPYAVCITHDVDNVRRPISHILRRAGRFSAPDLFLALVGARSLYNNLDYLARLEQARGMKSSIFFMSKNYDLGSLAPAARRLADSGWEVGLHGDFGTHDSPEALEAAASAIASAFGKRPRGLREHYLQFDYPKTWEVARSAGFVYDSTVGSRERLGFRLGLCTPFRPPDSTWRQMDMIELPLVLMDTTLWGYLGRTESEGEQDFATLLERVSNVNGLMTLLWHQESLRMKGGRIFPRLLARLAGKGCFTATGEGIARWWLERSRPLSMAERTVSMDSAPGGLVLTFKTRGQRTLSVEGGVLTQNGDDQLVTASGGPLRVKIS